MIKFVANQTIFTAAKRSGETKNSLHWNFCSLAANQKTAQGSDDREIPKEPDRQADDEREHPCQETCELKIFYILLNYCYNEIIEPRYNQYEQHNLKFSAIVIKFFPSLTFKVFKVFLSLLYKNKVNLIWTKRMVNIFWI